MRFQSDVKYPFDDTLYNVDDISVFVDGESLMWGKSSIIDLLKAIREEDVRKYQHNIQKVAANLQYSFYGSQAGKRDAFMYALKEYFFQNII